MAMTTSIHGGSKLSLAHNRRLILNEPHIDYTISHSNIVLERHDRHRFYTQIFGEAIEAYNKKQTRKDREIDVYDSKGEISGEKIVGWVRSNKGKEREFLIAFGHSNDTYDKETKKQLLLEYYEKFAERNPNLRVMDAVIHMDEAQPHMHIVVVPVATATRGVGLKVSMDAALAEQQGVIFERSMKRKKGNPFFLNFRDQELDVAKSILEENNIPFAEGDKRKVHLSTAEYKKIMTDLNRLNMVLKATSEEVEVKKQELERVLDEVKILKSERNEIKEELLKKRFFSEDMNHFYRLYEKAQTVFGDEFYLFRLDVKRIADALLDGYQDTVSVIKALSDTAISWIRRLKNEKYHERTDDEFEL